MPRRIATEGVCCHADAVRARRGPGGDPLLQPLFGADHPHQVARLTAFTAESLGGPDRFTHELGGFPGLIAVHRHRRITEARRQRFVELSLAALDATGLPDDAPFRDAFREHIEFGSRVALQNSHAERDEDLHPLREVPRWHWAGDDEGIPHERGGDVCSRSRSR